jgi:hypothetical protein
METEKGKFYLKNYKEMAQIRIKRGRHGHGLRV